VYLPNKRSCITGEGGAVLDGAALYSEQIGKVRA
jgi:hypothetical protein